MKALNIDVSKGIYFHSSDVVIFNQLARKIEMDNISLEDYYCWLDDEIIRLRGDVLGAEIVEKPTARTAPPLNTAIYYDTPTCDILPTGSLLRTSCNKVTHAFCAFKLAEDDGSVRKDHRYVFENEEKCLIQASPDSPKAVAIVQGLLRRKDIVHPGIYLHQHLGVDPTTLSPAVRLDSLRYTFFVWLDGKDALRCSIDRYVVQNARLPEADRISKSLAEVELAVYPRIAPDVAADPRLVGLIESLTSSLCDRFDVRVTSAIKYQRAASRLGI